MNAVVFSGLTFSFFYYIQSDDKSIVYQNRSGVCLDRSQYTGSKSYTDSAIGWNGGSCDQTSLLQATNGNKRFANFGFGSGKKLWADASSCSNFTENQKWLLNIDSFATECCGGKTACYQNRSGVCLDRSQYGSKSFTDTALWWSGTCDQLNSSAGDGNGNRHFANFGFGSGKKLWADASSCSDFTEDQKSILKINSFATECCGGKTVLDSCKTTTNLESGTGRLSVSVATIVVVMFIAYVLGN